MQAPPVYNRLYWNFTGGNGEVAYVQTFNITDVNGDGFIDASDAQVMFPQGHGDAWGHYLTALTVYYDLLRNPNYTWVSRPEAVSLCGVAVQVNYEDERKFAHAAAAKAQAGANIVDLTYRSAYVDDPSGQYQGYKDTDTNRAWGLSDWTRSAGLGAYFDWVTVNALLPAADTNPNDTGLSKVDRTTVSDIDTIPSIAAGLQSQLDKADVGLNPLGLAKNVVPFDIDPNLVAQGETHFEQIYGRAVAAMANAVAVWNQANQFTSALRATTGYCQQLYPKCDQAGSSLQGPADRDFWLSICRRHRNSRQRVSRWLRWAGYLPLYVLRHVGVRLASRPAEQRVERLLYQHAQRGNLFRGRSAGDLHAAHQPA